MPGITKLTELLASLDPVLRDGEFVFYSATGSIKDHLHLDPVMTFSESEGLTLILRKRTAEEAGLSFKSVFRQITLNVVSNLEAVGLTAAVSATLAEKGISANVVAAYYHDHIYVQSGFAQEALSALKELGDQ